MKVSLCDYDPAWAAGFAVEGPRLEQALAGFGGRVEHIGSTSVPGLAAKPVLDILIGLPDGGKLDRAAFTLLRLGYIYIRHYEKYMPYRRYLIRVEAPPGAELPAIVDSEVNAVDRARYPHTHHLHMVTIGSEFWTRHLLFREYLRTHDEARDAYAALKRELAQQDWESTNHYADAKSDFVRDIEAKAANGQ
ncbi:MAG TPA: GrpB family protein [Candidatus Obscuribacterales bacterium]